MAKMKDSKYFYWEYPGYFTSKFDVPYVVISQHEEHNDLVLIGVYESGDTWVNGEQPLLFIDVDKKRLKGLEFLKLGKSIIDDMKKIIPTIEI